MNRSLRVRAFASLALAVLSAFFAAQLVTAQQYDPKLYSDMRWRCIGPFRGGRTVAISGTVAISPRSTPSADHTNLVKGGVAVK